MEVANLIESFSEFKEVKNIDRETMMNILEDVLEQLEQSTMLKDKHTQCVKVLGTKNKKSPLTIYN